MSWSEIVSYVGEQMKTNQFFSAAALASAATAVLMSLKGVPLKIWERIKILIEYKAIVYQTDDLYYYLSLWMRDNNPGKLRNVEYVTELSTKYGIVDDGIAIGLMPTNDNYRAFIKDNGLAKKQKQRRLYELPTNDFFYKRIGWSIVRIGFGKEKMENASEMRNAYLKHFVVSGFFAKRAIKKLLEEVQTLYTPMEEKKCFLYVNDSYEQWKRSAEIEGKDLKSVILDPVIKSTVIEDIRTWMNSKEWYLNRGIAYKRGHLYYGPPGTGKTTLARAIALETGMNLCCFNLNSVSDTELVELMSDIPADSILLFEDIDTVFDGRKNLIKSSKLTFSGFLNALDGVVTLNDVFIIMTTNHIEKLDEALIRPGRIDKRIEIPYADVPQVIEYLSMFYEKPCEKLDIKKRIPISQIQNICLQYPHDMDSAVKQIQKL